MKPGSQYEFLDERGQGNRFTPCPFFVIYIYGEAGMKKLEVGSWKGWKRSVKKLKL